jgi:hypothetical protein
MVSPQATRGVRGERRSPLTHRHDLVTGFPQRRPDLLDAISAQEREVLCRVCLGILAANIRSSPLHTSASSLPGSRRRRSACARRRMGFAFGLL